MKCTALPVHSISDLFKVAATKMAERERGRNVK